MVQRFIPYIQMEEHREWKGSGDVKTAGEGRVRESDIHTHHVVRL